MAKKDVNKLEKSERKKYDLKIPYEFFIIINKYIKEKTLLGYSNVSQYLNELIRNEVRRILEEIPTISDDI